MEFDVVEWWQDSSCIVLFVLVQTVAANPAHLILLCKLSECVYMYVFAY